MQQRDDQAGAGGADRVPERAGAAVDVQLLAGDAEIALRRHRHHRERLVDLEQVDIADAPADLVEQLANRRNRRGREPLRFASDRFVNINAAAPSAFAEEAAGVMVPLGRNAGFRPGILAGSTFSGISSLAIVRGPVFSVTAIGTISALNAPPSTALRARVSVSMA